MLGNNCTKAHSLFAKSKAIKLLLSLILIFSYIQYIYIISIYIYYFGFLVLVVFSNCLLRNKYSTLERSLKLLNC